MKDVRKLSGRGTDDTLTTFINRRILQELPIKPQDRLVDIGCGDGTLLRAALQVGVGEVIGLSGTEEEAEQLRGVGLNVKYARSDSLPLPDQSASAVVANGVLHIVPADQLPASLREIARIAEPGARIWIGEIPRFREPNTIRTFKNIPEMLWWLLRERGVRTFLGMCRRLITGAHREPVLRTAQAFWAEPEVFIRMAADAGLKIQRHAPHQSLDRDHQPCVSAHAA